MSVRRLSPLLLAAALLGASACSDSDSDPIGPGEEEFATLTVDAEEGWALVELDGTEARSVSVADPSSSAAWDIGFFATSVMLNGGAAGPADVSGHCLCQNGSATDDQLLAFSAESEAADFEAVTEAQIPDDGDAWASDALVPAIDGWYSYDETTHVVSAAPENVWKVRTASGEAYAKLHVTGLEEATQEHPGQVTFEYALQTAAGSEFDEVRTRAVDVSSGPVHFDLESGTAVVGSDGWDVLFDGWDIRVNGGVSGSRSAGASLAGEAFGDITDASDLTASHYRGDAFGGVFDEHRWYRYDIEGNHQIWPTYDIYLIRRGEAVYKVQITSYYGETGDRRQITFRHARLR